MKAKTQLKDVKVLLDDGRLVGMIVDGDMTRVEAVISNVGYMTRHVLKLYSVYDLNTKKMLIDNSRILSSLVWVDKE